MVIAIPVWLPGFYTRRQRMGNRKRPRLCTTVRVEKCRRAMIWAILEGKHPGLMRDCNWIVTLGKSEML
jgi:hypothetical protein